MVKEHVTICIISNRNLIDKSVKKVILEESMKEEMEEQIDNKVILMGILSRDPEVRYSQGKNAMAVARYTLAVDRRGRKDENGQTADIINCVAFGRNGEFAEKYLRKGIRILISGRIQTGSYTNREGQKVYTTDIVVEEQEFTESKASSGDTKQNTSASADGFMNIDDGIDEELPFS